MKKFIFLIVLLLALPLTATDNQLKRWYKVAIVCQYYHDAGTLKKYTWLTPGFLYDLLSWRIKYKHLAAGYDYGNYNPENWYICWPVQETNCNPSPGEIYLNENGELDFFIMSMNEQHVRLKGSENLYRRIDRMFPELARRPDSDPEKNVAVWFLWLGQQKGPHAYTAKRIYNKFRPEVQRLYAKLAEVE